MKKVLIIGGNSYLAKSFIKTYHDSFSMKVLKRGEGLRDYFELSEDDFEGFDIVINFAAIVHDKSADEVSHKKYNFELVKYLAKLAKKAGIKHFIQMSTIAVYGRLQTIDSHSVEKPVTPYGIEKLKADEFLTALNDDSFVVSILRPPIVYGKDAPGNMASFIGLFRLGIPIFMGYFKNQRSLLCVDNFIKALYLIIEKNVGGIYLLKDKEMPSIGLLSETIVDKIGKKYLLLPIPSWLVKLVIKSKIGLFSKLFGDLVIDDSKTINILGEYHVCSWKECIQKMI